MDSKAKKNKSESQLKNRFYPIVKISHDAFNQKINRITEQQLKDNFIMIKKIRDILKKCEDLTEKQKLEFCESQRYFINLYLKNILSKHKD